ncbi:MAG: histidine kinase [Crocinitomicaceae bacterium]|nr:histidine kinase [Crocinitomicaceae bacterium]
MTKSLYTFDESKYTLTEIPTNDLLKRSRSIRIYGTSNHLWAAGTLPGAILFDSNLTPENGSLLYADFFISDIYQDKEGNILLSTFDKGVLVITDINLPDLIADFKDDPITSINATSANGFIAGTSKGLLVNYDFQNFKTLSQKGSRPIETIVVNPSGKIIVFDDGGIRFLNTVTNEFTVLLTESLKDGVFVNDQTLFLATNSGLTKIIFEDLTFKKYSMEKIADLNIRNYAIEFDPINSLLYVSTVNGLFCIDSSNQIKEIKYGGLPLFASTLSYESGKIYAPQSNPELLVIKGGEVIDSIRLDLENPTHIFKTTVYKNSVFANTSEGIYEFDKNGKFLRHFNNSYGNNYGRVLDFTIIDDILWVSNSSGLQTIDLNYAGEPAPVPLIEIAHIFANDIEISKDSLKRFDTEFRKFVFVVSSPTLKYKSDIKYHYQLKGYDEDWIIHDYASNEIVYNALAPGNYEFIVKAENQNKFSEPVSYKFSIASPFYATWWFVSILILTFLLSVYFIYKRQLNAQRLKARQINELNASKLTAIQSQMNPHFIFNSLNSIQDLILKGDVEHSYSYITTFSNLVRRTLNYSDKDFIDFEQELKLLELYLSLEKLRFKKDFSFSLETNSITDIQVPPMLIQPFIENALVHGLLHKEGEKKLKISFKLNDHLICTIEDNGIGRAQAKAIKERQRTDHESFSVQAIRKRFEILSNHFQGELGYTYEDLEENGKPSGTRVVLQIPVRHKF